MVASSQHRIFGTMTLVLWVLRLLLHYREYSCGTEFNLASPILQNANGSNSCLLGTAMVVPWSLQLLKATVTVRNDEQRMEVGS